MTTNPKMIATSDLQAYFVDKDSGFPLAGGIVTFYHDVNRTLKKPVYQITGSPPNYSYSVLPNPMILSGVGTFEYNGNDIIPYYFPYQGTPDDSDNTVELYYVTVESSGLVPQFTRQAWPPNVNNGGDPITDAGYRNLIPNGQFWAHTDIVGTSTPPVEQIDGVDTQFVAQGGWSFRRTTGGGSTFNNSFTRITTGIPALDDLPRYAFNYVCTSFSVGDQVRDLSIQWPDVNKFTTGNPLGTQQYTLFFAGKSNDANTYTFDLRMVRYYGTGGSPSPTTDVSVGSVIISPSYETQLILIDGFPDDGGTIGTNNDDLVMLSLRGPESSASIQVVDFALAPNNVVITSFPLQTTADMLGRGVAGWMNQPQSNAEDLGLPPILTPKGMKFDQSRVGTVEQLAYIWDTSIYGSISPDEMRILCDGTVLTTSEYSPLGVPWARLQRKFWNATLNIPIWGTGATYSTAYNAADIIRISTNTDGAQTAIADGATPTGFTITPLFTGQSTHTLNSYVTEAGNIIIANDTTVGVSPFPIINGSSGFTTTQEVNGNNSYQSITVQVPSLPAAGTYFKYGVVGFGAVYVWFTIDGVGSDPSVGGTGIKCPLLSSYTVNEAVTVIREAMHGFQSENLTTLPAASIPAGAYFTFHASGDAYAVWYQISNVGTAPSTGATNIKVSLIGTEINAQVATATIKAINMFKFAVPNFRNCFLKGMNLGYPDIPVDDGYSNRFSLTDLFSSQTHGLGSYQMYQLLQHSHQYVEASSPAAFGTPGSSGFTEDPIGINPASFPIIPLSNQQTANNGGAENRPFNAYINFVINY